jgi:hypothetical protein
MSDRDVEHQQYKARTTRGTDHDCRHMWRIQGQGQVPPNAWSYVYIDVQLHDERHKLTNQQIMT